MEKEPTPFLTQFEFEDNIILEEVAATEEPATPKTGSSKFPAPPSQTRFVERAPTPREIRHYRPNREAMTGLITSMEDTSLRHRLTKKRNAHAMWQLLLSEFETAYALKDLPVFKQQMERLSPKDFDKPESYFRKADDINERLGLIGDKFVKSDEEMNMILFSAIPDNVESWRQWKNNLQDTQASMTAKDFRASLKRQWELNGHPCGGKGFKGFKDKSNEKDHAFNIGDDRKASANQAKRTKQHAVNGQRGLQRDGKSDRRQNNGRKEQATSRVWSYFTRTKTDLSVVVVQHLIRYRGSGFPCLLGWIMPRNGKSLLRFALPTASRSSTRHLTRQCGTVPSSGRFRISAIALMLVCWRVNFARMHHESSQSPRRTSS